MSFTNSFSFCLVCCFCFQRTNWVAHAGIMHWVLLLQLDTCKAQLTQDQVLVPKNRKSMNKLTGPQMNHSSKRQESKSANSQSATVKIMTTLKDDDVVQTTKCIKVPIDSTVIYAFITSKWSNLLRQWLCNYLNLEPLSWSKKASLSQVQQKLESKHCGQLDPKDDRAIYQQQVTCLRKLPRLGSFQLWKLSTRNLNQTARSNSSETPMDDRRSC